MHPLAIFPHLLTYGLVAPLLLRFAVAVYILFVAKIKYKHASTFAVLAFGIIGIFLLIGLYTQVVAGLAIILLSTDLYQNIKKYDVNLEQKMIFAFAIVILLSLLFTGPGFLAFDMPL
jgi:hypothetical protein